MGFGKTGKAVATTILRHADFRLEWVLRRSHKLEHRSIPEFLGEESDNPGLIYSVEEMPISELLNRHPVDAIIDFSSADGYRYYAEEAARRGIKIISAVSHYPAAALKLLRSYAKRTPVFWSPNITIGVNYLIMAARFLRKIAPGIDMVVLEEHFRDKAGISGTARVIAENLELPLEEIKSVRAGGIIGRHEIICGFPYQTVRLTHESIAREAFGNGAIFVAQNLQNKPAGFYDFADLLTPYFAL